MEFVDRYGLVANFSFDSGNSVAGMKAVQGYLQAIQQAVNDLSGAAQRSRAGQQLHEMAAQVKAGAQGVAKQTKAVADQVRQLGEARKAIRPLQQEFRALRAEFRNVELAGDNLLDEGQFTQAARQVRDYTAALGQLAGQIRGNTTVEREFSAQMQRQQAIAAQKLEIAGAQRQAAIAAERVGISQVVRDGARAGLGPLTQLGGRSIRLLEGFGDQMSEVAAVSRATGKDLSQLRQQAKDLGASTRFSASQAAAGMAFLGRAGFSTTEILNETAGALTLATVGKLGLARSADIGSNILGGFALSNDQLGDVVDVLAVTASRANTSVSQLGVALSYAAPPAKAFGSDLQTTSAMIGVLGDAGIQGEKAGTVLRSMFLSLSAPSSAAQAQISALIGSIKDGDKIKPASEIFAQLNASLSQMGRADRLAAIKGIFGTDATSGVEVLLSNLDKLQGRIEQNYNAQGAGARMARQMNDNLAGSFAGLRSAMEGVQIEIAEVLEPAVRLVVDSATGVLRFFVALPQPVKTGIVGVGALAAGLLGLATAAGTVGVMLYGFQQAAATAGVAMLAMQRGTLPLTGFFQTAMEGFSGSLSRATLTAASSQLSSLLAPLSGLTVLLQAAGTAALSFFVSPVGLTVAALGGLYVLLEAATPKVSLLGTALSTLAAPLGFVMGLMRGLGQGLIAGLLEPFQGLTSAIALPLKHLQSSINQVAKTFARFAQSGEDLGQTLGKTLAEAILSPFQTAAKLVLRLWQGTIGGMAQLLQPFARFSERIGQQLLGNLAEASPGPTWWMRQRWGQTVEFILDRLQRLKQGAAIVRQHLGVPIAREFNLIKTAFSSGSKAGPRAPGEAIFDPSEARQALTRQVIGAIPSALAMPVQFDSLLAERLFDPIFTQLDLLGFSLLTLASMPMNLVQILKKMGRQSAFAGTEAPALLGAIEGIPEALALGLPTIVGGAIYAGFLEGAQTGISKAVRAGVKFAFGAFGREVPDSVERYLDGLDQSLQQVSDFIRSLFEIDLVRWVGNVGLLLSLHEVLHIPAALAKSATVRTFFEVVGKSASATLVTFRALAATAGYVLSLPLVGAWSLMAEIGSRLQASLLQTVRSIPLVEGALDALEGDLAVRIARQFNAATAYQSVRAFLEPLLSAFNLRVRTFLLALPYGELLAGSFNAVVELLGTAVSLVELLGATLGRFFPLAFQLIPVEPIRAVLPAVGEVLMGIATLSVSALGKSSRAIAQFLSFLHPSRFGELYRATDGFLSLGIKAITPLDIASSVFRPERKIIKKKVAAWFGIAARELEGAGKLREIAALSPLAKLELFGPTVLQILGRVGFSFLTLYTLLKPLDEEMLDQIAHLHWFSGRVEFLNQSFVILAGGLRVARIAVVGTTDALMALAQMVLPAVAVATVQVARGMGALVTLGETIRTAFASMAERVESLGRLGDLLQSIQVPAGLVGFGNFLGGLVETSEAVALVGLGVLFVFKVLKSKNPFTAFGQTISTVVHTLLSLPKVLMQVAAGIDLVGKASSRQGRQSLQFQTFTQGVRLKTGLVPGFDREFQQQQFARRQQVLSFQRQLDRAARQQLRRSGSAPEFGRAFSEAQLQQGRQQVLANEAQLRRTAHRSGVAEFQQLAQAGNVGALRLLAQEKSQREFINAGTLQSKQLSAHIDRAQISIGSASPVNFQGAAALVQQAAGAGQLGQLSQSANLEFGDLFQTAKGLGTVSSLKSFALNLGASQQEVRSAGGSLETLAQVVNRQQVKLREAIGQYEQLQAQTQAAAQPVPQARRSLVAAMGGAIAGTAERFGIGRRRQPQESTVLDPGLLAARQQELQRAAAARFGSPQQAQATLSIIGRFQAASAEQQAQFNRHQIELVAKTFGVKFKPETANESLAKSIRTFSQEAKRSVKERLRLMAQGGTSAVMAATGFMPPGTQGGMHRQQFERMRDILGEGRLEELDPKHLFALSRKLKTPVAQLLDPTQAVPFGRLRQANPLRQQFLSQRLGELGIANETALMEKMQQQLPTLFHAKSAEKRQHFIDQQQQFLRQGQTHRMQPELLEKMAEALSLTGAKAKGAVIELERQIAAQTLLAEESQRNATVMGRLRQPFAGLSPRRLAGGAEVVYHLGRRRAISSLEGQIRAEAAAQQQRVGQRQLGLETQLQRRRGLDVGQLQASLNVSDATFSEILQHLYQGRVEAIGQQSRSVLAKTLGIAQESLGDLHTLVPTRAELKIIRAEQFKQRVRSLFEPIGAFAQQQYQQLQQQLDRFDAPPAVRHLIATPARLADGLRSLHQAHQQRQSQRRYSLQQLMGRQGFEAFEPLMASLKREGMDLSQIQQFLRGPGSGQKLSAVVGSEGVEKIAKAMGLIERHKQSQEFDRLELKELDNLNRYFTTEVVAPFPAFLGQQLAGAVQEKSRELFTHLGRQTAAAGRWGVRAAVAIAGPSITRLFSTHARELGHRAGDLVNAVRAMFPRNRLLAGVERLVRGVGLSVSGILEQHSEAALGLRQQMFGRLLQFKQQLQVGVNALVSLFGETLSAIGQGIHRTGPVALGQVQQIFGAVKGAVGQTIGFFRHLIGRIGERSRLLQQLQAQTTLARQQRAASEVALLRGDMSGAARSARRATSAQRQQQAIQGTLHQLGPSPGEIVRQALGTQARGAQEGIASAFEGLSTRFERLAGGISPRRPKFAFMQRQLRVRDETGSFVPGDRKSGLRRVIPVPEKLFAGLETTAQRTARSISGVFAAAARQTRAAWRDAEVGIWSRSWRMLLSDNYFCPKRQLKQMLKLYPIKGLMKCTNCRFHCL